MRAVVDGVPVPGDLGVVAEVCYLKSGARVAIVAWDTGDVDQVTRTGRPDGSCGEIGAQRTGGRWSRWDAKRHLVRCLDGTYDTPGNRVTDWRCHTHAGGSP